MELSGCNVLGPGLHYVEHGAVLDLGGILCGDPHNPCLMGELGIAGVAEVLANHAVVVLRESKMEIAAPYRKMLKSARVGSSASMRARGFLLQPLIGDSLELQRQCGHLISLLAPRSCPGVRTC